MLKITQDNLSTIHERRREYGQKRQKSVFPPGHIDLVAAVTKEANGVLEQLKRKRAL
jgi:hypothetical protein